MNKKLLTPLLFTLLLTACYGNNEQHDKPVTADEKAAPVETRDKSLSAQEERADAFATEAELEIQQTEKKKKEAAKSQLQAEEPARAMAAPAAVAPEHDSIDGAGSTEGLLEERSGDDMERMD